MKGKITMHHNNLTENKKSVFYKAVFFLVLLTFALFIYLESNLLKDLFYFIIVFILFIKFLLIKLYH